MSNRRAQDDAGGRMVNDHAKQYVAVNERHKVYQEAYGAPASGCGARLAWIVRSMVGWAIIGVIIALFLTHGGDDPKAVEAIQSFAYVGTVVGFWIGVISKPK